MRGLSKLVLALGVVVLSGLALVSCNNDHLHPEKFWVSYGMVHVDSESGACSILIDEGHELNIVETVVPLRDIVDGSRVIVNYHILSTNAEGYGIRLNALSNIPVKTPFLKAAQTEEIVEGLGNDPVDLLQPPFFSFGEYLTVVYEAAYSSASVEHDYNLLVYESAGMDGVVFEFRHNARNDYGYSIGSGRVAFRVGGFIPEGKNEVNVVFKWKDIKGEERSENMLLKRMTE